MNELVYLKADEAITDSMQVAEYFHKKHQHVLEKIDKIVVENSTTKKMFKFSKYKANDNQEHRICYMNRDGFTLLAMGFNGKKAMEWKLKYIEAFNQMERLLTEKTSQAWLETRYHGKLTRKAETDMIQQLAAYAEQQGSKNSDKLFITYTNLANKMCGLEGKGARDRATIYQLNNLDIFENLILQMIRNGIEAGMHYKAIYQVCKERCIQAQQIAMIGGG